MKNRHRNKHFPDGCNLLTSPRMCASVLTKPWFYLLFNAVSCWETWDLRSAPSPDSYLCCVCVFSCALVLYKDVSLCALSLCVAFYYFCSIQFNSVFYFSVEEACTAAVWKLRHVFRWWCKQWCLQRLFREVVQLQEWGSHPHLHEANRRCSWG